MVKNRLVLAALTVVLVLTFLTMLLNPVAAWSGTYHLPKEWAKIWINSDGSIDLFYNITLTLDLGDTIHYVTVGQPQQGFFIDSAFDQYGNSLTTSDASSGSNYQVRIDLNRPLTPGNSVWFTLTTHVTEMIYNDTTNPGNLGLQFIPCWWPEDINDVQIIIIMPQGVTSSMVKTSRDWNQTYTEDNRCAVFWEAKNLSPIEQQQFKVGASFPSQYLPSYTPPISGPISPGTPASSSISAYLLPALAFFLFIGSIVAFVGFFGIRAGKHHYFAPSVSMETLGIKHGLTAVEASYLLDMKPAKIATEILYSVLQKRAVWVENTKPSIKLSIMPKFQSPRNRKELLRYYETPFLDTIKPDGTLDEEKLAEILTNLGNYVEEKMRGYCRRDTISYYKNVVTKAWQQVEQEGTPELASKVYDEQLLWLLMDPDVQNRTKSAFTDRPFQPSPMWFWYWYGYQHFYPNPTYHPNIQNPAQSPPNPPQLPGTDFANNIATSLEQTSNNIVLNIEKFAISIVPTALQKTSQEPVHHNATCACACHACACACACVSCACACAGGGVG
jgi:hypothetical protein